MVPDLADLGFVRETLIFQNLESFISDWIERCTSSRRAEKHTHFPKTMIKAAKYMIP